MRLAWITDPHLDWLPRGGAREFGSLVRDDNPDVTHVVITGDLAEFDSFKDLIEEFAKGVGVRVYFVTGNHDAYNGSIRRLRSRASLMQGEARWLPSEQLVQLGPSVALVGQDGWYDCRYADPRKSHVLLNDFIYIQEFGRFRGELLYQRIREVADNLAAEAKGLLEAAVAAGNKHIVFATHVPPFAGAAWHEGKVSDHHWLPWMSSRATGKVLDQVAQENPDVNFTVLCGHTHGKGTYQHDKNLLVLTGESAYRFPRVSRVFGLEDFPCSSTSTD